MRPLVRVALGVALAASCVATEVRVLEDGSAAKATGLGNEALIQGRYETAIQRYREALAKDPRCLYALFNLGVAYQRLDQLDESRRWYEAALKVDAENPQVLCNLGWLAYAAGDAAGAVERFEAAARLTAHLPHEAADCWFDAGAAREKARQWQEARRAYDEALALDEQHVGAHYNLGTLYLGALADAPKALGEARAHLTRATELEPARVDAWLNLAVCVERAGEDPQHPFDQAVAVATPADAARARWQRALWYDRCQPPRRTAMRDDLVAALAESPDFPQANGKLGAYEFAIGDYDAAIGHLEREVDGKNFDAACQIDQESHYLLATIYAEQRPDPVKALAHATAYYQLHPDSAKIHELRRRVLASGAAATASRAGERAGARDDRVPAGDGEHVDAPARVVPAGLDPRPAHAEH